MSNKLPPDMHVFGPVDPQPAKMQANRREPGHVEHYHQYAIDTNWYSDSRVLGNITDPVRPRPARVWTAEEYIGFIREILIDWEHNNETDTLIAINNQIEQYDESR